MKMYKENDSWVTKNSDFYISSVAYISYFITVFYTDKYDDKHNWISFSSIRDMVGFETCEIELINKHKLIVKDNK